MRPVGSKARSFSKRDSGCNLQPAQKECGLVEGRSCSINPAFSRGHRFPILVLTDVVPDAALLAFAESHAFARAVAFAGRDAVPSVVFARHCNFAWSLAGVLFPAAAEASGAPALAWQPVCPAAADIFCQLRYCQCSAA